MIKPETLVNEHVQSYICTKFGDFSLNKANLRDLIAVTGLVILLKLDSNRRFFVHMTWQFDGWPQNF